MNNRMNNRIGEQFRTNEGYIIEIIRYNNANNLWVEFQDEHKFKTKTIYQSCKDGTIKNPYHPSVYEHGFIGEGKYKPKVNNKHTKYYTDWHSLMQRGFSEEFKNKYPTYKDVIVNEECFCLQDFGGWFDENYYEIEGETMCLDKDILVKGNKEYSFDNMVYVPHRINTLFTKDNAKRGDLPIGVSYNKKANKYRVQCSILTSTSYKPKHLGYYNTPEEAFLVYKEFKEAYIKQVADEYKGRIPDRLYEAMYAWKVEIDD